MRQGDPAGRTGGVHPHEAADADLDPQTMYRRCRRMKKVIGVAAAAAALTLGLYFWYRLGAEMYGGWRPCGGRRSWKTEERD